MLNVWLSDWTGMCVFTKVLVVTSICSCCCIILTFCQLYMYFFDTLNHIFVSVNSHICPWFKENVYTKVLAVTSIWSFPFLLLLHSHFLSPTQVPVIDQPRLFNRPYNYDTNIKFNANTIWIEVPNVCLARTRQKGELRHRI